MLDGNACILATASGATTQITLARAGLDPTSAVSPSGDGPPPPPLRVKLLYPGSSSTYVYIEVPKHESSRPPAQRHAVDQREHRGAEGNLYIGELLSMFKCEESLGLLKRTNSSCPCRQDLGPPIPVLSSGTGSRPPPTNHVDVLSAHENPTQKCLYSSKR